MNGLYRTVHRLGRASLVATIALGVAIDAGAQTRDDAAERAPNPVRQATDPYWTRADLRHEILRDVAVTPAEPESAGRAPVRHPAAAFALSALVPGAGQAYNRQWVKAAVGVAVEAALVAGYVITRNRGLDAEDDFQLFAHRDWNPAQYAAWLNDYGVYLEEQFGATITAPAVDIVQGVDFHDPGSWTAADRSAVSDMFSQIRAVEQQAFHPETGAAFSHQLPEFGDQQYYELIGKYFQFAPGWEDYPDWIGQDGQFTASIDPEMTGAGGTKPNVSPNFFQYADDHGHAQDVLRTASRMSLLFVANHLIAGIDAAVTAKIRRDGQSAGPRVSPALGLEYTHDGLPAPSASVSIRF